MARKRKRIANSIAKIKKSHLKIGGIATVVLALIIIAGIFYIKNKKIQTVIESHFNQSFQISQTRVESNFFSLKDLSWHWEVSAELKSQVILPVELKNFRIQARRRLWGTLIVEKAVLQVTSKSKDTVMSGGIEFKQNGNQWLIDLTNLEISIGEFRKPIGTVTSLSLLPDGKDGFDGKLVYEGKLLDISLKSLANSNWTIQFPKQKVITNKEKLPFGMFSNLRSTGEWNLSSRMELNNAGTSGATVISTKDAVVNISGFGGDFFQNQRGVALLSLDIQSSESDANGTFEIDLTKSALELNNHKYFKRENDLFKIKGAIEHNRFKGKVQLATNDKNSEINFLVHEKNESSARMVEASFADLPLELMPRIKGLGTFKKGNASGTFGGTLVQNGVGSLELSDWNFNGKDFKATWENLGFLGLPGLEGDSLFDGKLEISSSHDELSEVNVNGNLDLQQSEFNWGGLVAKQKSEPFTVKIVAQKKAGDWQRFEGSATSGSNYFKYEMQNGKSVVLSFPQIYKTHNGSFTGTVELGVCSSLICENAIKAYNLNLSDWTYEITPNNNVKISGQVSQNSTHRKFNDLRLQFAELEWLKLDGEIPDRGVADLKIEGGAMMGHITSVDPGMLFKLLKFDAGKIKANIVLKDGVSDWKWKLGGLFKDRTLKIDEWTLTQEAGEASQNYWQGTGQAEISLEEYFLRNGMISLTSTAEVKGRIVPNSNLAMQGALTGDLIVASKGYNLGEWIKNVKARLNANMEVKNSSIPKVFVEAFKAFSNESKSVYARNLLECLPQNMVGKIDLDLSDDQWTLSPSLFSDLKKESMLKFQGDVSDFGNLNLQINYLPGPKCNEVLSSCLGDAFPKGGIPIKVAGSFKDPEADLDFLFLKSALEKCVQSNEVRNLAAEPQIKKTEQDVRVKKLKNFYRTVNKVKEQSP